MTNDRNGRGAGTPRRPAESSVVFSLDSLRTLAQGDAEATARARQAGLPSFSGSDLAGLAAAPPRRPEGMPIARPVLAPSPSNLPLVLMIGILMVTTVALAAYIVIDPRPRVIVTHVAAPDPSQAEVSVETTAVELVPDASPRVAKPALVVRTAPEVVVETATPSARKVRSAARVDDRARDPVAAKVAKPDSKPRELPIECVLDPHAAGCGAKAPATVSPPKVVTIDPNLPETLSASALRGGMASVKEAAKSCGAKHGGSAGEKVKVKLSITGANGAVESTAAEGAHRGTALGNCVAAALKKATFPRFAKQVIGLEYTITL